MPKMKKRSVRHSEPVIAKFGAVLAYAEESGLLSGNRDALVRGRMPKALVEVAKARAGTQSDTKLLEIALANLAYADEYAEWLISQRGTIPKEIDLEL